MTLRAPIVSAVMIGTTGYFVLSEASSGTLWSADLAPVTPVAQQIALAATKPSFIARSGSALVLAELRTDGTTALSYFASPDFTKTPATASVAGLASGGVALSGLVAAVSTFNGVTLADFANGTTTLLPQSSGAIALRLAFAGTTLVEMTDTALLIWNTQTRTLTKQFTLPAAPAAVHVGPDNAVADLATEDGITSVQLAATTRLPSLLYTTNGNAYYKKLVAGSQRLYFFDGRNVDIFTNTMQYTGGIRTPLIIDVAASDSGVFTIQNNLAVTSYGREGNALATSTINEGSDVQAQAIATAGGAAWASIFLNCHSSGCEGKTIVFDPKSAFAQTATMTGVVRDVMTNGNRAFRSVRACRTGYGSSTSATLPFPAILFSHARNWVRSPRRRSPVSSQWHGHRYRSEALRLRPRRSFGGGERLASYVSSNSHAAHVDLAEGFLPGVHGPDSRRRFCQATPAIRLLANARFVARRPGTFYFPDRLLARGSRPASLPQPGRRRPGRGRCGFVSAPLALALAFP